MLRQGGFWLFRGTPEIWRRKDQCCSLRLFTENSVSESEQTWLTKRHFPLWGLQRFPGMDITRQSSGFLCQKRRNLRVFRFHEFWGIMSVGTQQRENQTFPLFFGSHSHRSYFNANPCSTKKSKSPRKQLTFREWNTGNHFLTRGSLKELIFTQAPIHPASYLPPFGAVLTITYPPCVEDAGAATSCPRDPLTSSRALALAFTYPSMSSIRGAIWLISSAWWRNSASCCRTVSVRLSWFLVRVSRCSARGETIFEKKITTEIDLHPTFGDGWSIHASHAWPVF